ncbi:MAG: hypothetical protein ACI4RP_02655 [Acutalibacteraceae bacterium]
MTVVRAQPIILRKKVINLKVNELKIDAYASIGPNTILVDIVPSYIYENGRRTEKLSGYRYVVALPAHSLDKLSVKIEGDEKLLERSEDEFPVVEFDGLVMSLYWTPSGYQVSARASGIRRCEE